MSKRELALDIIKNYDEKIAHRKLKIYNLLNKTSYSLEDIGIRKIKRIEDNLFYNDVLIKKIPNEINISNISNRYKSIIDKLNERNSKNYIFDIDEIEEYEKEVSDSKDKIRDIVNNLEIKYDFNFFDSKIFYFYQDDIMLAFNTLSSEITYCNMLVFKVASRYVQYESEATISVNSFLIVEFEKILQDVLNEKNIKGELNQFGFESFQDAQYYFNNLY